MGRPAASYFDLVLCPVHMDHVPAFGPHPVLGPILSGDTRTLINGRFAARQWDFGVHAGCVGPNLFVIAMGSPVVDIGGRPAARQGDLTLHCGIQPGVVMNGAPNVLIGDAPYGGGGTPMAPTPRVAAEVQKRDELELKAGGGGTPADQPAADQGDAQGPAEPAERAFPAAVVAEPAPVRDAPPEALTPEKVEEELKKDAGQEPAEDKPVVVLAGTIADLNGTPLPRETVVLLQADGTTEVQRSELDDKGRYLFRDIPAGSYKLAVFDPEGEPWTLVPAPPAAGPGPVPKPVSDGSQVLVVRVVDNGLAPQKDLRYTLKLPDGAREGQTDAAGVLCELSVPAGELELEIAGKPYKVPSQSPAAQLLTPFDLVLEAAIGADARAFIAPYEAPNPLATLDPVDDKLEEL